MMNRAHTKEGLRIIAIFEAAKGMLILLAGFEVLAYIHKGLHLAAEQLVRQFHLNPASHYPHIFMELADHVTDAQLWALAVAALIYVAARFIEAIGLWLQQQWAEWFGVLAAGLYIPLELFEIVRGVTWPRVTLLIVNAGIVGYLAYVLRQAKQNLT